MASVLHMDAARMPSSAALATSSLYSGVIPFKWSSLPAAVLRHLAHLLDVFLWCSLSWLMCHRLAHNHRCDSCGQDRQTFMSEHCLVHC